MSGPVDIGAIAGMLQERAESLARALLPQGHREGNDWVEARTSQGGLGDSLKVCIAGNKRGVWKHFAANVAGDMLDLVAYIHYGGAKGPAVAWSRNWLGLNDAAGPATIARPVDPKPARGDRDTSEKDRRAAAFRLWLEAEPQLAGTPAADYLLGRGIDLGKLGRQPRALRYHPALPHKAGGKWPALLAAISGNEGKTLGVHRTYLDVQDDGRVIKAPLADAKMTLGRYRGGSIRIWRGERVDSRTGELKPGRPLAQADPESSVLITEGIEDALTLAVEYRSRRILCAVSLSNMASLWLPGMISEIVIVADNDAEGSPAADALEKAIAHFRSAAGPCASHIRRRNITTSMQSSNRRRGSEYKTDRIRRTARGLRRAGALVA